MDADTIDKIYKLIQDSEIVALDYLPVSNTIYEEIIDPLEQEIVELQKEVAFLKQEVNSYSDYAKIY